MAASPRFKVYDGREYIAATKDASTAVIIAAVLGDTITIRNGHYRVVWSEGSEALSAAESYDEAAATIEQRIIR